MVVPPQPNPNHRLPTPLRASWEWVEGHRREVAPALGGFVAGLIVMAGIGGCNSGESSHASSIERCPIDYVSEPSGRPGIAIRRFSKAEARVERLITLDQGNTPTLKGIRDDFGDTSDNGIGNFLCQDTNSGNIILSPHAESILGRLLAVKISVPPYTK